MPAGSEYKELLLQETREELAKADAKASILLAGAGIVFAALLTTGSDSSWYPNHLHHHAARIAAWLAIASAACAVVSLGAAVKPRMRSRRHEDEPKVVHYFGDVEAFRPNGLCSRRDRAALAAGRTRFGEVLLSGALTESALTERMVDQIWTLGHIAYVKYRYIYLGVWFSAFALGASITALIVEEAWL